jgi:hypothetical protein
MHTVKKRVGIMKTSATQDRDNKVLPNSTANSLGVERRGLSRIGDDADWESKVLGRIHGRVRELSAEVPNDRPSIGWETSVLDVLRRRIERGPV